VYENDLIRGISGDSLSRCAQISFSHVFAIWSFDPDPSKRNWFAMDGNYKTPHLLCFLPTNFRVDIMPSTLGRFDSNLCGVKTKKIDENFPDFSWKARN
jgi:hypothetical protein